MTCPVIIYSNQKGGVGKTTTCRELGLYIASTGRRVCLIDIDPQGNLSRSLVPDEAIKSGLYEAFTGDAWELVKVNGNLALLAGDKRLAGLEKSLVGEMDAFTRLKDLLADERFSGFDYIFIDSPPSLGILTGNGLAAATHFIIPMSPALYTLQGTNDLMDTVSKVRRSLNPDLSLLGVIINAYDAKPVISRQISEEIRQGFGDIVFTSHLSRTIKIEEAIAGKTSVTELKKLDKSRAKDEVSAIGDELLTRLEAVAKESAAMVLEADVAKEICDGK
jgi:chromosome partitioning protein